MARGKLRPPAMAEIVFDLGYLLFAAVVGIFLFSRGNERDLARLYGLLALLLCVGDAFHLLPRVYSLYTDTMRVHYKALGLGKLVTSVTMTLFYVLLYFVWQLLYHTTLPLGLSVAVFVLAALRILLCLLPQNRWFSREPSYRFAIYRNIPFVLLGAIVATLFAKSAVGGADDGFRLMCPAIVLSFLFYLAVVLLGGKYKKLGMLMLPKTGCYIWMLCMGFSLL